MMIVKLVNVTFKKKKNCKTHHQETAIDELHSPKNEVMPNFLQKQAFGFCTIQVHSIVDASQFQTIKKTDQVFLENLQHFCMLGGCLIQAPQPHTQ